MKTKCKKCGYSWESNSSMILVSCPSCGNKVRLREIYSQQTKNFGVGEALNRHSKYNKTADVNTKKKETMKNTYKEGKGK